MRRREEATLSKRSGRKRRARRKKGVAEGGERVVAHSAGEAPRKGALVTTPTAMRGQRGKAVIYRKQTLKDRT